MQKKALIIGCSGITGSALAFELMQQGWQVTGLSRGQSALPEGVQGLTADLTSAEQVTAALSDQRPDAVFFTVWSRQENEKENIRVNGAIVRHVIDALGDRLASSHVALVTGLKHYMGPFEAYGAAETVITPFREEQPRQPVDNFYYAQEDEIFAGAERYGYRWSVHRPHTVIGAAQGNAMNMGQTLAVYAALCREQGWPFVFPGSPEQWQGVSDVTDAGILARQLVWATDAVDAQNEAFNIVNGEHFRWKWLWPRLANYFGIESGAYPGHATPLDTTMQQADAPQLWAAIAEKYPLQTKQVDKLASWWHTDADLGRPFEAFTDMTKSRLAGFMDYQSTEQSFYRLFDQLIDKKIIPDFKNTSG
ncbi:SDR family oxidoreductase [Rosenbergiella epipactidis]|uniref:SDR family oxidoreductase n=1 Tax=Rosenbergiella epipactidis TaxID=1544694 RepID=UPI001F4F0BDC|nr:SDR family oxidoreductase [Rosenbergiella epipactidis]